MFTFNDCERRILLSNLLALNFHEFRNQIFNKYAKTQYTQINGIVKECTK